ncbi:MAG: hypothetical protein ACRELF_09895 [Gemmataceae bacterium]
MNDNDFDKAGRACFNLDPAGMLRWLLPGLSPACTFQRWADARTIAFPGDPERTCDNVAELLQADDPPIWWLLLLELQSEPDAEMFGRLLEYLGRLWRTLRTPEPSPRRYHLAAALVNFKGHGQSSRDFRLPGTPARTCLRIVEKNVARMSAARTLARIRAEEWTRTLLPLIPLMRGGDKSSMVEKWKAVAESEPDDRRRDAYANLAWVFADATGCRPIWKQGLEDWNVKRSEQVMEWQAEAKADYVIKVLRLRFGPDLPAEVEQSIRNTADLEKLDRWLEEAVRSRTLNKFRQALDT